MKKQLQKSILLALCLCFFLSLPVSAKKSYPAPTDAFFVNDFANVISEADEQKMQALGEELYRKTKAQVVVVTVPNMQGETIENYGYDLANAWGIGDKDDDSGVLLLFAKEERKIRIEVGSGLEGQLPDGKTGRILDNYAIPLLRENHYSEGLERAYWALCNETYKEFGLEMDGNYQPVEESVNRPQKRISPLKQLITLIAILAVITFLSRRGILVWPLFFGGGGHGGGFSGGGGGFSGGGFSGGGGGFSGGGSSRDF